MINVAVNFKTHEPNLIKPSENPTFRPNPPEFHHLQLLKKCTQLNQFKQIHTQIIKNHPTEQTNFQLAKLIESLVTSTHLDYARRVFDEMAEPSTFVFNTMVRAYAVNGLCNEGIHFYINMKLRGISPDNFTYPFLLKACTSLNQGKGVHSVIVKSHEGFESDVYSQTSLISFYSSYGDVEYAQSVFDKMPQRNVVSWTAMITAYVKQKRFSEGLALFHRMQREGVEINELTLVNVLDACAHLGAFEMGKWVHGYIDRSRVFLNPTLATALIDMYAKCGYIHQACQVFEKLPQAQRSVCTWNSIIRGLAMHGFGNDALKKFMEMQKSGIKPDDVTFIGVLSACTHSGMVEKGKEYFNSMVTGYGIEPNIKHYGCLVDLLGRAGYLSEAFEIVKNMPIEPNCVVWGTFLNACALHANVELAEIAMEKLVKLEPSNDGNYVIMSNIYAANGRWNDVSKTRRLMKDGGITKNAGCSFLIEVDNRVHEFMVGDTRHPRSREIYCMLDDIAMKLKGEGYVPVTSQVLLDANEEEKRQALCHHSEKLAIAFGLISSTNPHIPIRVMKNLRACIDCHVAAKLISKIYDREIIVRDRNRFHHFKNGTCSCNDFW